VNGTVSTTPTAASSRLDAARGANGPTGDGGFDDLLDKLERLVAEHKRVGEVRNPEQLKDAIRTAEHGYVTAMDLRRRLEQACRARLL
jgi:hypothetical protein